jgi:hypothetical protein
MFSIGRSVFDLKVFFFAMVLLLFKFLMYNSIYSRHLMGYNFLCILLGLIVFLTFRIAVSSLLM